MIEPITIETIKFGKVATHRMSHLSVSIDGQGRIQLSVHNHGTSPYGFCLQELDATNLGTYLLRAAKARQAIVTALDDARNKIHDIDTETENTILAILDTVTNDQCYDPPPIEDWHGKATASE